MNLTRNFLRALVLATLGAAVIQPAIAGGGHGGHGHGRVVVGIGIGAPYWGWGWGYGYPYYPGYYYPPAYYGYPAYAPAQPTTYIQQEEAPPAPAPQQGYWYYCSDAQAYYPYVKECPGGWQRVSPQPAR